MSDTGGVRHIQIGPDDATRRLDRWLKLRYPQLPYGLVAKILRTGQVRVDGRRAKPDTRLAAGQTVRIPPLAPPPTRAPGETLSASDSAALQARVLHIDDDVIAIDKPSGLAVQGGTGTRRHLNAMLEALRYSAAEPPRLVHRLDKDTSGVLLLARNARSAKRLATAFKQGWIEKVYWALVVGVPSPRRGSIDMPLVKRGGRGGEKVVADREFGKSATTDFEVIEVAGRRTAWLALMPRTGRTHQLRVHLDGIGNPIVGDGKYGGAGAFLPGVARRLHLHARSVRLFDSHGKVALHVVAPLSGHMAETWEFFGFDVAAADDATAGMTGEWRAK